MSVCAVDVDSDGDMDVLSACGDWFVMGSNKGCKIAWYENDGNQSFSAHTLKVKSVIGSASVYAADVDSDGDIDVLSSTWGDDTIAWYENDGSRNFSTHTIAPAVSGPMSVYAVDVDGDQDMDVLSASLGDDKIAWYENDGSQSFSSHTITTKADGAGSVYAVDVDNDGDVDVLSASPYDDKIAWYENDGSQNFSAHIITKTADEALSVYSVDVDGDGDMDVLSASWGDNKIAWYENRLISGVEKKTASMPEKFTLQQNYPNPFNPTTTIEYEIPQTTFVQITICDIHGRHIKTLVKQQQGTGRFQTSWDGTDEQGMAAAGGLYFCCMRADEFTKVIKLVLVR